MENKLSRQKFGATANIHKQNKKNVLLLFFIKKIISYYYIIPLFCLNIVRGIQSKVSSNYSNNVTLMIITSSLQ